MALWDGSASMELDRHLAAKGIRHSPPTLGQTLGDPLCTGHAPHSFHYADLPPRCTGPKGSTGQARDFGLTWPAPGSDCEAIAREFEGFALGMNYVIVELFWTRANGSGIYYSHGARFSPGADLRNGHRNHCHVALRVGAHLPAGSPVPVIVWPKEAEMPIAYVERCAPGEQIVVALPPIESDYWSAVFVSLASQAGGTTARVAVEPSARILHENEVIPKGRKVVYPMQEHDEAISIVNKGSQPISVLVEAK
jgi:hypothetical protein